MMLVSIPGKFSRKGKDQTTDSRSKPSSKEGMLRTVKASLIMIEGEKLVDDDFQSACSDLVV